MVFHLFMKSYCVIGCGISILVSTLMSTLFQLFNRKMLLDSCCFIFVPSLGKEIPYWIIVFISLFQHCFNIKIERYHWIFVVSSLFHLLRNRDLIGEWCFIFVSTLFQHLQSIRGILELLPHVHLIC